MEIGREELSSPDLPGEHAPGWTKPPNLDEITVAASIPPHLSGPVKDDPRQGYDD